MNLTLRNEIADWMLEALESEHAVARLRALISFAGAADAEGRASRLRPEDLDLLRESKSFEESDGGLRLRPELSRDLPALRERASRFERALVAARTVCGSAPAGPTAINARGGPEPQARELDWLLCAAAALFNERLFFEVHELLEPAWGRAREGLKTFLQGLIQVAVGLHHHENGNLRGALSLLSDGNVKLESVADAGRGLDLATFRNGVRRLTEAVHAQLAAGRAEPLDLSIVRLRFDRQIGAIRAVTR